MNLKLNDIYNWYYSEVRLKALRHGNNCGTTYWCKSQTAIVQNWGDNLMLFDTYWYRPDSPMNLEAVEKGEIILEFVANLDDYIRIGDRDKQYYDDSDILNLHNQNNPDYGYFLKKGAQRSVAKMSEVLEYKCEEAAQRVRSAEYDEKRAREKLAELSEETKDQIHL